jgi:hypothetical protein
MKSFAHSRIVLLVLFLFTLQISGLSACGGGEGGAGSSGGGTVQSNLTSVNDNLKSAITEFETMAAAVVAAKALADAGSSSLTRDAWVDGILPQADKALAAIDALEAAESNLQGSLAARTAARSGNAPDGQEELVGVIVAGIGLAGMWAWGRYCKRKGEEMQRLKEREAEALANGDSDTLSQIRDEEIEIGKGVANNLAINVMTSTLGNAGGAVGTAIDVVNNANSIATEVQVVGSSRSCRDVNDGDDPTQRTASSARFANAYTAVSASDPCKVVILDTTASGDTHRAEGVPSGTWDMVAWANGIARTVMESINVSGSVTEIVRGLIPIVEATGVAVTANDDGSYTPEPVDYPLTYTGTMAQTETYSSSSTVCRWSSAATVNLQEGGTVTGSTTILAYIKVGEDGAVACTGQNSSVSFTGTWSGGSVSFSDSRFGLSFTGSYTDSSLTATSSISESVGDGTAHVTMSMSLSK